MKTIIYIAGPIKGNPRYKQLFDEAAQRLKYEDQVILNPAALLEGMEDKDCLPVCLQLIELADMVALLPGWESSLGATTEAHYALRQGKSVLVWEMKRSKWKLLSWSPERGLEWEGRDD